MNRFSHCLRTAPVGNREVKLSRHYFLTQEERDQIMEENRRRGTLHLIQEREEENKP